MQKKTALVTGATGGIGRAIVARLLGDDWSVIGFGNRQESVARLRKDFGAALDAGDLTLKQVDFQAFLDAPAMADDVPAGLVGLVHCAGECATVPLAAGRGSWERVLFLNLSAPYLLTQAIVEAQRLAPGASIVNISSQLGSVGRAGYSAYCASKHGLNGLTKVWAAELGERKIRVNAVAPGWIETEMTVADIARGAKKRKMKPAALRKEVEAGLHLRRMNRPDEVAAIVAFLLSEESSGITGRIIEMAGPSA